MRISDFSLAFVAIFLVVLAAALLAMMRSSPSSVSEIDSVPVHGGTVTLYSGGVADPSWVISYRYSGEEEQKGEERRLHVLGLCRRYLRKGRVSVHESPDGDILLITTSGKSPVLLGMYVVSNDESHTFLSLIGKDREHKDTVFAMARRYCPRDADDHWFDSLDGECIIP